jgi:hypothetical protein
VNVVGKLDEGNLHVQFDEGALETGLGDGLRHRHEAKAAGNRDSPSLRQPRQCSTLLLLGFAGPRAEAEAIKAQLTTFLRDTLKLELSEAKTMITHARTQTAHCLGHELRVLHRDQRHTARKGTAKHVTRSINGMVELRVPATVLQEHCARYLIHGKPRHRNGRIDDSDFTIVATYQAEYRGLVEY